MANKPIKDTIHAKGFDIGIYTTDYENEFISLTDIARYKSSDPNDVIKNWMSSSAGTYRNDFNSGIAFSHHALTLCIHHLE